MVLEISATVSQCDVHCLADALFSLDQVFSFEGVVGWFWLVIWVWLVNWVALVNWVWLVGLGNAGWLVGCLVCWLGLVGWLAWLVGVAGWLGWVYRTGRVCGRSCSCVRGGIGCLSFFEFFLSFWSGLLWGSSFFFMGGFAAFGVFII